MNRDDGLFVVGVDGLEVFTLNTRDELIVDESICFLAKGTYGSKQCFHRYVQSSWLLVCERSGLDGLLYGHCVGKRMSKLQVVSEQKNT